jgi:hypothetical protein
VEDKDHSYDEYNTVGHLILYYFLYNCDWTCTYNHASLDFAVDSFNGVQTKLQLKLFPLVILVLINLLTGILGQKEAHKIEGENYLHKIIRKRDLKLCMAFCLISVN